MSNSYRYFGVCSGLGAQISDCEKGPEVLFPAIEKLYPINTGSLLFKIYELNLRVAESVSRALKHKQMPIVIGGDHSIAIGTWNGVQKNEAKPLSLVWIDAHMDGHTFETSPSQAIHGMPLAALLGYGEEPLAKLCRENPVLLPENLTLIGVRSYEEGEAKLFEKLGVRVYGMKEVREKGLREVIEATLQNVKTDRLGLSLDLDVIDPEEAPGVGSPEKGGLFSQELLASLELFKNKLSAFELVEYNPHRDVGDQTKQIIYKILDVLAPNLQREAIFV